MLTEFSVSLWTAPNDSLILLDPNGIVYRQQAGGTLCAQPHARGYLLPLGYDDRDEEHEAHGLLLDLWVKITGPGRAYTQLCAATLPLFHDETGPYKDFLRLATPEELEPVQHLLLDNAYGEAWIPVVIHAIGERTRYTHLAGYENCDTLVGRVAILTRENSD